MPSAKGPDRVLPCAAGVAASLALARQVMPREVRVPELQDALIARGAKLSYFADVESSHPHFAAIQWAALRGFVPADELLCFHPDDAIRWGDFVTAVVQCLRIPVSVTSLHFENLSPREREVLEMLAQGFIYKEIGDKLNISTETVRTYVKNICQKMHVRSRLEAIAKHRGGDY